LQAQQALVVDAERRLGRALQGAERARYVPEAIAAGIRMTWSRGRSSSKNINSRPVADGSGAFK
jgi:hypothetical protein